MIQFTIIATLILIATFLAALANEDPADWTGSANCQPIGSPL